MRSVDIQDLVLSWTKLTWRVVSLSYIFIPPNSEGSWELNLPQHKVEHPYSWAQFHQGLVLQSCYLQHFSCPFHSPQPAWHSAAQRWGARKAWLNYLRIPGFPYTKEIPKCFFWEALIHNDRSSRRWTVGCNNVQFWKRYEVFRPFGGESCTGWSVAGLAFLVLGKIMGSLEVCLYLQRTRLVSITVKHIPLTLHVIGDVRNSHNRKTLQEPIFPLIKYPCMK